MWFDALSLDQPATIVQSPATSSTPLTQTKPRSHPHSNESKRAVASAWTSRMRFQPVCAPKYDVPVNVLPEVTTIGLPLVCLGNVQLFVNATFPVSVRLWTLTNVSFPGFVAVAPPAKSNTPSRFTL